MASSRDLHMKMGGPPGMSIHGSQLSTGWSYLVIS
jgi:hypothetical protein